jgi:tetratricopeptide (TPR) repeat protein
MSMRYMVIFASFFSLHSSAQAQLQFNQRLLETENKWIVYPANNDGSYTYGFVYIDSMAGMTFNREGTFIITPAGTYVPSKMENASYKVRLGSHNNKVDVALVPETKFTELEITAVPDWLSIYQRDPNTIGRLFRWGYLYNGYGECAKGLSYLEKAQKIDPKYKGLAVELAFSYNCLDQYDKAIAVLEGALKENPADPYTNKELIYAELKSGQLDKAAASCKKAIAVCTDTRYNAENCYNLLYTFFKKKDKENFVAWLPETKKWTADKPQLANSIKLMEAEMAK